MNVSHDASRARFPFTLPGVLLVVAGYATVHATTRLLASRNLGEDDPAVNLAVQTLSPGYSLEHGPLYDWLIWLAQQLIGAPGLPSFLAVKYGLLVLMAGCIFSMTRRLTGSPLWAFVAVESMAAVYQIFWRFHEGFTHRAGAMALVLATLWTVLRLVDRPSRMHYALLGVLLGCGLLSEHIYVVFVAALLFAAWPQAAIRRVLLSPSLLSALALAGLIAAPYGLWLLAEPGRLNDFATDLLPTLPAPTLPGLLAGLKDALTFPIFVMAPWSVLAPLVFPAILRRRTAATAGTEPDLTRFIGRLLLVLVAVHVAFNGIIFAKSGYPVHSILPMMVIALPWVTARIAQSAPSEKRTRIYMLILLAFTLTAYAVRSGNLFVYEPFCSRCRWGTPYAGLAGALDELGFRDGNGTLVADDIHTAGNLRRFFPESRVLLSSHPGDLPVEGPVARLWLRHGEQPLPDDATRWIDVPWQAPLKPAGHRHTTWAVRFDSQP